jgi:beta-glucuronidase
MRAWITFALAWALALPTLAADALRPSLLLTARTADQDLSGRWTWSKDLYRTGFTDINGWPAKPRMQRFRDVDVAAAEAKGGAGFFEYDLDRAPAMDRPRPRAGDGHSRRLEFRRAGAALLRRADVVPAPL